MRGSRRAALVAAVVLAALTGLAIWYVGASDQPSPPARPESTQEELKQSGSQIVEAPVKPKDTRVEDPQFSAWANAIKVELIRRDDAESLIVAALLTTSNYAPEAVPDAEKFRHVVELLQRASARAPSNAAVQWLAWLACTSIVERKYPCDADVFVRALRSADPKNAVPLIAAIDRAREAKDERAEAEALAALEAIGGFNSYYAVVEPMLFNTIESVRIPPPPSRAEDRGFTPMEMLGIGISAWMPLPKYKPLLDSCSRLSTDPLAPRCLAIAKEMWASDTFIVRRIGVTIAERVTPFGTKAFGEISDERRRLNWLSSHISELWLPPETMVRLAPTAGGEVEMWQAWLRENGIPVTPPVDWEGK